MFGWYLFGVIVVFSQQKSLVARDDYLRLSILGLLSLAAILQVLLGCKF